MSRNTYPSDLTDEQWQKISMLIAPAKKGGRPRTQSMREIVNAIFYVLRAGCPWRYLPHDFPVWQTVYYYFRLWEDNGTWEKIHYFLRAEVRVREGRNVEPSAACRYADLFEIADYQSVKVAGPGIETGYDGGKQVKGRKRQILVDTLGLLLAVFVHDAHRSDQAGFRLLVEWIKNYFPRLRLIWVDKGYQGRAFAEWITTYLWFDFGSS